MTGYMPARVLLAAGEKDQGLVAYQLGSDRLRRRSPEQASVRKPHSTVAGRP